MRYWEIYTDILRDPNNKLRRIGLVGFYGGGNLGDEAILTSLIYILQKNYPNLILQIYSFGKLYLSSLVDTSNLKVIYLKGFRKDIIKIFLSLKDIDFLIIGGGGLFHDYQLKVIIEYFLWGLVAKLLGKKVFCVGVGVGPFKKKFSKYLFRIFVKYICDEIQVRDVKSYQLTSSIVKNLNDKLKLSYDLVLFLDQVKEHFKKEDKENPYIIISLRYWSNEENVYSTGNNEEITGKFIALIRYILKSTHFKVLLLPFSLRKDLILMERIVNIINNDRVKIFVPQNLDELFCKISNSKAIIGMRLHSLILAVVFRVPFLGIIYDSKVRSFLENFDKRNLISIRDLVFTPHNVFYEVGEFLSNPKFLIEDDLIKEFSSRVEQDVISTLSKVLKCDYEKSSYFCQ